jgi:predicted lipid-binding transport protein (Tim44 family)
VNLPLDIILIGLVAVFLVLQLRRVLGRRHGEERQRPDPMAQPGRDDKVIDLPRREQPDADLPRGADVVSKGPAEAGLTQIKIADPSFDARGFVQGARQAFEMIVSAYAQGDTKTLRPLLSDEVYERFASAIKQRLDNKEKLETGLVGFEKSEIAHAEMRGSEARVTVKFVTEQINVTRNADELIVDGNPNEVTRVTDLWTFARDTRSSNPNWQLVATEEPAEG